MLKEFTTIPGEPQLSPIRDIDRMVEAFHTLFHFRMDIGLERLEAEVACRRMLDMWFIGPDEYAMCSENTRVLASIYLDYMYEGAGDCAGDFRIMNYYPLLDRVNEWLDETYGN